MTAKKKAEPKTEPIKSQLRPQTYSLNITIHPRHGTSEPDSLIIQSDNLEEFVAHLEWKNIYKIEITA